MIEDSFSNEDFLECVVGSFLYEDTVQIFCFNPYFELPWGANILLTKDTFNLELFAKSDYSAFKLNQNDSLSEFITIPTFNEKLVLTSRPQLSEGESIEGCISFQSEEHYEVLDSVENKLSVEMNVYFNTGSLVKFDDQIKPFEEISLRKNYD